EHDTRVWTFTLVKRSRHLLHAAWQTLWYHAYRKPSIIIATNEQEDLVVFKRERLNLERPQKLGPLDVGLIYFRRHLAQRARDYQRLGAAPGALKSPPRRAVVADRRGSAGSPARSPSSRAPAPTSAGASLRAWPTRAPPWPASTWPRTTRASARSGSASGAVGPSASPATSPTRSRWRPPSPACAQASAAWTSSSTTRAS